MKNIILVILIYFAFSSSNIYSQHKQCDVSTNFNFLYTTYEYYFSPEVKKITSKYEPITIENQYQIDKIINEYEVEKIKALIIYNYGKFSIDFSEFTNLEYLYLSLSIDKVRVIPNEIFNLKRLKHFAVIGNISILPKEIWSIKSLKTLNINVKKLDKIEKPKVRSSPLENLKLYVTYTDTTLFDYSIFNSLEFFQISSETNILNPTISKCKKLKCLYAVKFDTSFYKLDNLESLYILDKNVDSTINFSTFKSIKEIVGYIDPKTIPKNKSIKNLYLSDVDNVDIASILEIEKLEYLFIELDESIVIDKNYIFPETLKKIQITAYSEITIESLKEINKANNVFIASKKININPKLIEKFGYKLEYSYDKSFQYLSKTCLN